MGESRIPTRPGWYYDPDGRYTHQAYWDGEKWTGQVKGGTPGRRALSSRRMWAGVLILVLALWLRAVVVGDPADTGPSDRQGVWLPTEERIELEGLGGGESRTFALRGGSYEVRTRVGSCYYAFTLMDASTGWPVRTIPLDITSDSVTVDAHQIRSGAFFMHITAEPPPSCPWTVVFTLLE